MPESDYTLYSMPALLSRSVKMRDPVDPSRWITDQAWYKTTREIYLSLFKFLQEHELVARKLVESIEDVDNVIVRASDLTSRGRAFISTGADERWLKSFDRPGASKDPSDVRYLVKSLAKVAERDPM